jgi:nucleoside-diphosphate-sugar epimerase
MPNTALILGATGRIGRHADRAFSDAGWTVRRFRRGQDLTQAARGADVIVNGWNPPYSQWQAQVPGLTAQVIAAAQSSGATVILPGNIYVYGPDMPALIGPETSHRAEHPLGLVRREMEADYRKAGVRTIVLRAGDFLDDQPSGNWFDKVIAKRATKGRLSYPGRTDVAHAWAWLPDLARAMVELAEIRDTLPGFTDLAFPGLTLTGAELAQGCAQILERPVAVNRMSWLPLHLARPFWSEAKFLLEMRYLWDAPHQLDGAALDRLLPERAQTPLASVLARALQFDVDPDQPVPRRAIAV